MKFKLQCFLAFVDSRMNRNLPILIQSYHCLLLLLIVFFSAGVGRVYAKELYLQPSVNVRTEYDDNKRLRTDSALNNLIDQSAFGLITEGSVKLGARTEKYDVQLDNRLTINRYDSDLDLDSDDFEFNLSSSFNATEKNIFSLNAGYQRDTTLTSELTDNGTGLVQDNIARTAWSVSPNWTYIVSATQYFQAAFSHNNIKYADSEIANNFDYTTDLINLSYSVQWTELFRNYISVSAMSFQVPEIGSGFFSSSRDTLEYSINIGADYQISPTWSSSFSVGQRFTNTEITGPQFNFNTFSFEQVTSSSDVQGLVFSFSLDKEFETGSAAVSYSRSTNAQGNGQLQVRDVLDLKMQHYLNDKLSLLFKGGVSMTSNSGNENDNNGRTLYRLIPSIQWSLGRNIYLLAGYKYRMQELEREEGSAISNSVFLNFSYNWDKLGTQRY